MSLINIGTIYLLQMEITKKRRSSSDEQRYAMLVYCTLDLCCVYSWIACLLNETNPEDVIVTPRLAVCFHEQHSRVPYIVFGSAMI